MKSKGRYKVEVIPNGQADKEHWAFCGRYQNIGTAEDQAQNFVRFGPNELSRVVRNSDGKVVRAYRRSDQEE